MRHGIVLAGGALAACCLALAAPVPKPAEGEFQRGWDKPTDPGKKGKFTFRKDSVTIEVPGGTDLDISVEGKPHTAPMLLRDAGRGDFRTEVRVTADWAPHRKPQSPSRSARVAAGLVFLDGNTARKAERGIETEGPGGKSVQDYLRFVSAGRMNGQGGWPLAKGARSAWLRLERRGEELTAAFSPDGKRWDKFANDRRVPHGWNVSRDKGKVGVYVRVNTKDAWKATFDRWRLTPLPKQ